MKKLLVCLMATLGFSGVTSAATVGCFGPGASYNVVGLTLSCGGLTFSNFQVFPAGGNQNPVIEATSAAFVNDTVSVGFNPNMSTADPATGTHIPQDIHFFFQVTGGVQQVELAVGGVNATIIERACSSPIPTSGPQASLCPQNTQLASMVAFSAPPGPNVVTSAVFQPTPTLYVFKDIAVAPGTTGGALTSFNQSFVVPEPLSLFLMGSGLLAVGLLRRRRKK
jgi:hypothetical protein